MKTFRALGAIALALEACVGLAGFSAAQDSRQLAASADEGGGLEEITVYAQKRGLGESNQKVPIAITAVSANTLEEIHSVDVRDLGKLAPNVQTADVGTTPAFPNFTIRGIGVNSSVRSIDPAVNIVVDGMTVGYQAGAIPSTFDLESIEILRGPQGVLFGRNSTGGAIVLRTRRPSADLEVTSDVTFGNFREVDVDASIGGKLPGTDKVLAKVAVISRNNDGYIQNTNDGLFAVSVANPSGDPLIHAVGNIPKTQEVVLKPTLTFLISEDVKLNLFTQYENYKDGGAYPFNFTPPPGSTPVALQTLYGFTPTAEAYATNTAFPGYVHLEAYHGIGELNWQLGAGSVTSIAAYRHITFNSSDDLSGSPFVLFYFPDNRESDLQGSFESRYNLPVTDALNLNAGVYYFHSLLSVLENRRTSGAASAPLTDVYTRGVFHQKDDSAAGFADADYSPTSGLTLSVGGRYTWERKVVELAPLVNCVGVGYGNCPLSTYPYNKDWRDFSPRVAIDYQMSNQSLVYADATRGFRSGNFNTRVTTPLAIPPANPEKVTSYEIGSKNDLFDKTLRVNAALFWEDYKDIQELITANQAGTVVQSLINAAHATIKGAELEMTWEPVSGWQLDGSGGWIDAKYDSFNVPLPGGIDGTKLKFARVPEWTAYIAGTKRFNVSGAPGTFSLRSSYDWRSGSFDDFTNTPVLFIPGYGLVDANLTYEQMQWKISVFGRNLANTVYSEQRGRNFAYVEWGGQPRTYGVELSFHLK
jgi:iron complex outermembrane receptor protein